MGERGGGIKVKSGTSTRTLTYTSNRTLQAYATLPFLALITGISASGVISERFPLQQEKKTKYYDISSQR
jgi:hypothetical protein